MDNERCYYTEYDSCRQQMHTKLVQAKFRNIHSYSFLNRCWIFIDIDISNVLNFFRSLHRARADYIQNERDHHFKLCPLCRISTFNHYKNCLTLIRTVSKVIAIHPAHTLGIHSIKKASSVCNTDRNICHTCKLDS